jgi:aminobenzoyl-glutamate utilization protein B
MVNSIINKVAIALIIFSFASLPAFAVKDELAAQKKDAIEWIDKHKEEISKMSDQVWTYAETALLEYKSSRFLADELEKAGFTVERGVAGLPTAFVATYGAGEPIIGFLGEYDALPGLSQKAGVPYKEAIIPQNPGHGCGHNLLGVGSITAAMAVKQVMEEYNLKGTIKFFGCPAEETVVGKVYMAREGLFDSLSAALDWHPGSKTQVSIGSSNAMNSFKVSFKGKTAHSAGDPWNGRSALDAVELMDVAANFLREHVKPTVRIHYVILKGGKVPNVVPDEAEVWYFVRDLDRKGVEEVYKRLVKIAEAAALATGTDYKINLITGVHRLLPLPKSSEIMQKNLEMVGSPGFTEEEQEFARQVQKALGKEEKGLHDKVETLKPPEKEWGGGSTDVAEVSWITPTLRMNAATCPLEAPGHSWAIVCTSGSTIGHKGTLVAAKTLATTALDLLTQPKLLEQVRAEWKELTKDYKYKSPLPPDSKPPILPEPEEEK